MASKAPKSKPFPPVLGLLAGGGQLPLQVANAALAAGSRVVVVAFTGMPQPIVPAHKQVMRARYPIGSVGKILAFLREQSVHDVVLAGNLTKPSLFKIKPDMKGLALLARALRKGDDSLLRTVCTVLAEEGFTVHAAHDLCPQLLAPTGAFGKIKPTKTQANDIAVGAQVLAALGPLDIGQAVVVKESVVLGVEAVEGTDNLLKRCADLRGKSKGGVLVKMAKPTQTTAADLPTIGTQTIELLKENGYAGVAMQAGKTLVLDLPKVVSMANAAGLFVVGVDYAQSIEK
ncbi:MAG: UDP-2,3-diacylglucosamine diphosphatase LpxI [Alphaproteobacteria bacterium]